MRLSLALALLLMTATGAAAGIPPIRNEQDWALLRSARDGQSDMVGPSIVPLLHNAIWWDAWDKSGAAEPDYAALLKTPAEFRAHLFLIAGQVSRIQSLEHMPFRGPWDDKDNKLQEYDILTDSPAAPVAVVLLVDGPPKARQPEIGQSVEIVARFYKVLRREGTQTPAKADFPELVGKTILAPATAATVTPQATGDSTARWVVLLLLLVVSAAVLIVVLRKKLSGSGEDLAMLAARARLERQRAAQAPAGAAVDPSLPKDPAAALDELARRQNQSQS